MFSVNVDELVEDFRKLLDTCQSPTPTEKITELKIIQDQTYRRFKSTVDLDLAIEIHFWKK